MSTDQTIMLPAPRAGRLAAFLPGGGGRDSAVVIHLEGYHTIFRFTVNMLDHQIEFAAAAHAVLVDLRDHMTPEQFDPMARSLLGEDRYAKLQYWFERNWDCRSCERDIRVGRRYAPLDDAGALCAACCNGHPEYVAKLVKRTAPRGKAETP